MKKKLIVGGGLAALVVVGAAIAAPELSRPRLDANGDGVITLAEMQQQTAERFKRMDTNGDGKVTEAEREASYEKWGDHHGRGGHGGWQRDGTHRGGTDRGDRFTKLDPDGDGTVTVAEMQKQAADRIAALDTNKDGKITRDEFAAGRPFHGHHGDT